MSDWVSDIVYVTPWGEYREFSQEEREILAAAVWQKRNRSQLDMRYNASKRARKAMDRWEARLLEALAEV